MLKSVIKGGSTLSSSCFFIDALDELEGDQSKAVNFISDICNIDSVKVCTSSRPYDLFEQKFAGSQKLHVQDLTRRDIWTYAHDGLEIATAEHPWRGESLESLSKSVCMKAEGVFLWATLAIKSLREVSLSRQESISEPFAAASYQYHDHCQKSASSSFNILCILGMSGNYHAPPFIQG